MNKDKIELNGVNYIWPENPVVVVCIDGGDQEYYESGVQDGIIPNIENFMKNGFYSIAQGSMPSFTCPNNMSIVTGSEPKIHGISGNYYLDKITGEPVVMTGPELLRSVSIMTKFCKKEQLLYQLRQKINYENNFKKEWIYRVVL